MPISKPPVPAAAVEAFSAQLPDFVWLPPGDNARAVQHYVGEMGAVPTLDDLQGASRGLALFHDAHQLFVLGLKDVANNGGIDAAKPAGWRFFAGDGPGKTLLGTVTLKANVWRMTAGYYGDRVWTTLAATSTLNQLTELEGGNYELRVLAVPGLNLEVFWLANTEEKEADLVVPIPPMPDQPIEVLNKQRVYSMANFLAAIRPLARLRLTAESKYGG